MPLCHFGSNVIIFLRADFNPESVTFLKTCNTYLYVFTISFLHLSVFRYVDIVLGLSFLATHLVLMYSSKHESRSHLTLYFVLSVSTLLLYWSWFVYLKYGVGENEASKEVTLPQISQDSWFIFWMEY